MSAPRGRSASKLALALALAAAAACGTRDTETSVYLEIYDPVVVQSPTQVTLDVFDHAGGTQIATLDRTADAQTSASSPLGSVVILAGANASVALLHIEARRSNAGSWMSSGSVDVPLIENRQVTARLMLGDKNLPGDAGASGAGGAPASGAGGAGGASGAGGTGGSLGSEGGAGGASTPPVDAGVPPTDSGSTLAGNGVDCRSAGACASGFCVDGVCCDGACDALCHGCNLSGSRGMCKVFAAGSQCVPASCTTTGDDLIPARTCDGNGNCNAAGATQSCGRYRCQNDACLRSCSSNSACISSSRCAGNRCQ